MNKLIITIVTIIAIVIIELVALCKGIDGVLLAGTIAVIAGLGGYGIAKKAS